MLSQKDNPALSEARLLELHQLIARGSSGDRAAFDALYEVTSARLYAICLSLLPDRPLAEQALQRVYADIWRGTRRPNDSGTPALAWLDDQARASAAALLPPDAALPAMPADPTPVMPPARARNRLREELGMAQAPFSEVLDSRIRWWQRPQALLGAVVAVLVVAAVLLVPVIAPSGQAGWQTQVVSQPAGLRVDVSVHQRDLQIALQSGAAPVGRDWELWWMAPDGAAPVSLGLVPHEEGSVTRPLPQGLDAADGVQIALSDEPEGGAPAGVATGPIIAISTLSP